MKKIGIMTFHAACNYGAILQTYALYNKVKSIYNNYEVEIIDYYCKNVEDRYKPFYYHKTGNFLRDILRFFWQFLPKIIKYLKFQRFKKKYLSFSSKRYTCSNIDDIIKDYYIVIVGSDQVWNLKMTGDDGYFLPSDVKGAIRASYAASFGFIESFECNKIDIIKNLKNFNYISLREDIGFSELKKNIDNNIININLDPTLLLEKREWDLLCSKKKKKRKFALVYCVLEPNRLLDFVNKYSNENELDVYCIGNNFKYKKFKQLKNLSVENFLWYIKNAEVVFTTSFHGCAFSILYKKNFFVELNTVDKYNSRVEHLLDLFNIDSCNIESNKFSFDNDVSWNEVNLKIQKERNSALYYLENIYK